MPSPFPGMDPYIESQLWADFHTRLVPEIAAYLMPGLRPRYTALVEERVYVETEPGDTPRWAIPDVSLWEDAFGEDDAGDDGGVAVLARPTTKPVTLPLNEDTTIRQGYIAIYLRGTHDLVTVIEVLSPSNKGPRGAGRREYLAKRDTYLDSHAHLVEVDLVRAGLRLPMGKRLPAGDYYAFVSRVDRRPFVDVWPVALREPLPTIPIPLRGTDPDVPLDLQEVFTTVYDRAGYDYLLDYHRDILPPLTERDAAWAEEVMADAPQAKQAE